MKNLTERAPEPFRKNPVFRGFGLAWLILIAGYWAVTSIDPMRNLFWRGYFSLVPPVVAALVAVAFIVRGDKDFAGGIFAGLVSMLCVIVVLVIFLIAGYLGNSTPFVNGWK
ncbi:hypothetical protein KEC55_17155 [Burkholderia cepacia]|uniref:hypothetical protein n=1 Tax=Burkholderia cepacia TaxID=292 RepID=UPI00249DD002|nr:hypothetical protein [Burkholderia cepacia]WGY71552.1 hypothetical protein KEC55_17155 [Burkholderia cepacia]